VSAKAFWATVFVTATGAAPLTGVEGAALNGAKVATLTTTEPSTVASNFKAIIDWGDGNISPGTVAGPRGGPFAVTGDHTYAEEGAFSINVMTSDQGAARKSALTTATIADAALSAQGTTLSPTEGTPFTATKVATFTDADPGGTASDYTATIDWGDGTSSAGTVTGSGPFTVSGDHTYAEEGPYTATVKIVDIGSSTVSVTSGVTVADAALHATGRTFNTTNPVTGKVVSTFTDDDPTNTATDSNQNPADYTATIDWGDGSPVVAGTVAPNGTGFNILGSHAYPTDGPAFTYSVKSHVCDVGGSCADATSTINLLYLTGRSYGAAGTISTGLGVLLRIPPTPDTGPVATTAARSTTTPCTVTLSLLLVTAHDLCANVTTTVNPQAETGTSTGKASVTDATILSLLGVPTITVTGVQATSLSTCTGATGTTTIGSLRIGGALVAVSGRPNSSISLPGGTRLVINEQLPVARSDFGMTVNGVHLIVPTSVLGGADVVLASATSDIHNCPSTVPKVAALSGSVLWSGGTVPTFPGMGDLLVPVG
jgi:hypothetical protein